MSNSPSPFSDQTPQPGFQPVPRRRYNTIGIVAAAGLSGLLLCCLCCGGLVYLGSTGISSREPSAEEKSAVVTIRDLEPHGVMPAELEKREVWKTKRHFDGTLEIEYEYDPELAAGAGDAVTMQSSVSIEHTEKDASQAFSITIMAYQTGLRISGVKSREQQHAMADVDQTHFALLLKDDQPVGNMLVIRKGKRIYGVLIVGIYFDDPAQLEEIVREKIKQGDAVLEKP